MMFRHSPRHTGRHIPRHVAQQSVPHSTRRTARHAQPPVPHSTRRTAVALLAAGSACLVATLVPAVMATAAEVEPGSGLGSFSLSASAPALQFVQQDATYCYATPAATNGCEGVMPETVATLRNGPIGRALSSVVWPGVLAGNLGSLLITAGGEDVPDEARMLNYPIRAEAFNSTGKSTVTNEPVPGTKMSATALDDRSIAEASVSQSQVLPIGTFGRTTGKATTALTGVAAATATAHSEINDIDLAAGVVHIGSVISDATATTDGTRATAKGKTVASGITIAGIPVTVDGRGVTANGNNLPAGAAQTAVNTAMNNAGMSIALGEPMGKPDGASITYQAGSLVFLWKQQPGYTMTVVLGGANVSVTAAPAFDYDDDTVDVPVTTDPGTPLTGTNTGTGTVSGPVVTGGLGAPAPQLPDRGPAPTVSSPVLAATAYKLPGGTSPLLVLGGLLGAGLIAAGLKRLPDRVLLPSLTACLFEENT